MGGVCLEEREVKRVAFRFLLKGASMDKAAHGVMFPSGAISWPFRFRGDGVWGGRIIPMEGIARLFKFDDVMPDDVMEGLLCRFDIFP